MKIWIKVEIGAQAQVEERESICANDWEWTRGPNEVARPGSGEGSGGALGLRFPPSHPGTGTAPSLLPWVASKVNTLYPGLWATRAPSTAMKVIIMVIKNQHINPKGWLKESWGPESLGSGRSSNSQTSGPLELITPWPIGLYVESILHNVGQIFNPAHFSDVSLTRCLPPLDCSPPRCHAYEASFQEFLTPSSPPSHEICKVFLWLRQANLGWARCT